jgi:hypothetical protein
MATALVEIAIQNPSPLIGDTLEVSTCWVRTHKGQVEIERGFADYYLDLGLLLEIDGETVVRDDLKAKPDDINGGLRFRVRDATAAAGFDLIHAHPRDWHWDAYDKLQREYRARKKTRRCKCGMILRQGSVGRGTCQVCADRDRRDGAWNQVVAGVQQVSLEEKIEAAYQVEVASLPTPEQLREAGFPKSIKGHDSEWHIGNSGCVYCLREAKEVVQARLGQRVQSPWRVQAPSFSG